MECTRTLIAQIPRDAIQSCFLRNSAEVANDLARRVEDLDLCRNASLQIVRDGGAIGRIRTHKRLVPALSHASAAARDRVKSQCGPCAEQKCILTEHLCVHLLKRRDIVEDKQAAAVR